MWRSDNWENTKWHLKDKENKPIQIDCEFCFELGADTMLKAVLRELKAIDKDTDDTRDFTRRTCDLIRALEKNPQD